jgi:hypothetical protein
MHLSGIFAAVFPPKPPSQTPQSTAIGSYQYPSAAIVRPPPKNIVSLHQISKSKELFDILPPTQITHHPHPNYYLLSIIYKLTTKPYQLNINLTPTSTQPNP